jgi:hypothetical protein
MGEDRCLVRGACFDWGGRTGVIIVVGIGRRTGMDCFFIVAIAAAVDDEEVSTENEGLRRFIGPGRFSTSHEEADRCTP